METRSQFISENFRFERLPDPATREQVYVLSVGIVKWSGPHTSRTEWKIVESFKGTRPKQELVDEAIGKALNNKRYFKICMKCLELNNIGHMFSDYMCEGCAEVFLGVIH